MNFFSFISLKTEIDKAYKNCLKKKPEVPEISKEAMEHKEELNKQYKAWHKNTYNPFFDYYNSSEK